MNAAVKSGNGSILVKFCMHSIPKSSNNATLNVSAFLLTETSVFPDF